MGREKIFGSSRDVAVSFTSALKRVTPWQGLSCSIRGVLGDIKYESITGLNKENAHKSAFGDGWVRIFKSGTSETRNLIDYRRPWLAPVSNEGIEGYGDSGSGEGTGGDVLGDSSYETLGGDLRFSDPLDHAIQCGTILFGESKLLVDLSRCSKLYHHHYMSICQADVAMS